MDCSGSAYWKQVLSYRVNTWPDYPADVSLSRSSSPQIEWFCHLPRCIYSQHESPTFNAITFGPPCLECHRHVIQVSGETGTARPVVHFTDPERCAIGYNVLRRRGML